MNPTRLALALGTAALAMTPVAAEAAKPPKPPATQPPATQPPAGGGKLTLAATPNPIKYGSLVTLSGRLNGANNGGQAVSLQSDPFPFATFKNVATATTNATGDYSLTQKPLVNTHYQTTQGGNASGIVAVLVRPRVSLRLTDYTPKSGQLVRFSGRVCPQHDGSTLLIQRHYSTGYRTVRKTTLRDIPGSTCSSYKRTFRIYRDGRYHTAIARHGDHFTGVSAPRVVNAHR